MIKIFNINYLYQVFKNLLSILCYNTSQLKLVTFPVPSKPHRLVLTSTLDDTGLGLFMIE